MKVFDELCKLLVITIGLHNSDCIIISLLDTVTSLLAGCVIFAVLGNMAKENNEKIENVVTGGEWHSVPLAH